VTTPTPGATALRPEVGQFLTRVREHLADLSVDDRDELLDGLDADLSEQLAEGGVLPDPVAYAAELRAAAGLPAPRPAGRVRGARRSLGARLVSAPDDLRAHWLALTARNDLTRQMWSLLEAVRPAWWVLRAWVAVSLLDALAGPWENLTLLPTLGVPVVGPVLLLVAIVISVRIGQGRLWPGSGPDRSMLARLVLATLNLLAILAPLAFHYPGSRPYVVETVQRAVPVQRPGDHPVLRSGRDVVRNVYAYDAEGQPLQGVQLFDQQGRPISVAPQSSMGEGPDRQVTCPWFNGTTPLFNVFPLPQRTQRYGSCLGNVDPAKVGQQGFHEPPLASVPPVTLPAAPLQ
jgi:hypothetical protein